MVDFNAGQTISTPAIDIVRILILQKREHFLESLEAYYKIDDRAAEVSLSIVRSRLRILFLEIQALLKRKYEDKYESVKKTLFNNDSNIDDLMIIFLDINELLDKINLTKIDTRRSFDFTDVEADNAAHGL